MNEMNTLDTLPIDALFEIFSHIPPETLLSTIPLLSKSFLSKVNTLKAVNNFWEDKFKKHFPKAYRQIEYKADIKNWLEHFKQTYESTYKNLPKPLRRAISCLKENDPDGFIQALDAAGGPTWKNLNPKFNSNQKFFSLIKKLNNPKISHYLYEKNKKDKKIQLYWDVVCKRPLSEILPLLNEDDKHILDLFMPPPHYREKHIKKPLLLHLAAKVGYIDLVKYLIKEKKVGPDLSHPYEDNEFNISNFSITPAQLATRHSHLDVLKYLLEEQKVIKKTESLLSEIKLPAGFPLLRYLMEEKNLNISVGQLLIFLQQVIEHYDDKVFLFLIKLAEQSSNFAQIKNEALSSAILNQDLDVIKFLIEEKKATFDFMVKGYDKSPLYCATTYYSSKTVQYFIEKGADPNGPCFPNNFPSTSVLHHAVRLGKLETVKVLVEHGAKTDTIDNRNHTPFDLAVIENHLDIVQYFIKHENNLLGNKPKYRPLHIAITHLVAERDRIPSQYKKYKYKLKNSEKEITLTIKHIIDQLCADNLDLNGADENGRTALHLAARLGLNEIVKYLIEKGADVNLKDHKSMTALHVAAKNGDRKSVSLLTPKNKKEASAFCQQADALGQTPIQLAILKNHFPVAKFLINKLKSAEINSLNSRGFALLHYAAAANNLDTIKHLLKKGARVDQQNRHGATALYHIADSAPFNLDTFKYVVEEGNANIHTTLDNGDTLLHCAIRTNNLMLVQYLLQKGFPADVFNKAGHHALYYAVRLNPPNFHIIRCLVEEGHADVNLCTFQGNMPLHCVAASGHTEIAKYLIENSAIINPLNPAGESPLDLARKHKHVETAKFLAHNAFLASIESHNPELIVAFLKSEQDPQILQSFSDMAIQYHCLPAIQFLAGKQSADQNRKALVKAITNNFPEAVALLLPLVGPNITIKGFYQTPLALALYYKNKPVIEHLLNHPDIKPDLFFFGGVPTIILAAIMGDRDIIKKMLAKHVNVNVRGPMPYETPLIAAIASNQPDIVKLLLEAGADPELHFLSPPPLKLAHELHNPEIIALLSQDLPQKTPTIQISSAFFQKAPPMSSEKFRPHHCPKI